MGGGGAWKELFLSERALFLYFKRTRRRGSYHYLGGRCMDRWDLAAGSRVHGEIESKDDYSGFRVDGAIPKVGGLY